MQGGKNGEGRHGSFGNTSQASRGFLMSKHQKTHMRKRCSKTLTEEKHETKILSKIDGL